jgi:hypothetical protein
MELSPRERAMLDLERDAFLLAGRKDAAIRARFAMSPTRYYQLLRALIEEPAALVYDPLTVKRLRRDGAARRRLRVEGRHADPGPR